MQFLFISSLSFLPKVKELSFLEDEELACLAISGAISGDEGSFDICGGSSLCFCYSCSSVCFFCSSVFYTSYINLFNSTSFRSAWAFSCCWDSERGSFFSVSESLNSFGGSSKFSSKTGLFSLVTCFSYSASFLCSSYFVSVACPGRGAESCLMVLSPL